MNYITYSELEGKHSLLAPSRAGWENKSVEEILELEARSYAQAIGTAVHDICRMHIKRHKKISSSYKEEIKLEVMEFYKIPAYALNRGVDFNMIFETARIYTNDAIGYRLVPEQQLCYDKEFAFGTADTISDINSVFKNRFLRIHDYKSGVTPVHMEQLVKYAALFCLQYNVKPIDIQTELRIYQLGECAIHEPNPDEIYFMMETYKNNCEALNKMRLEEK